MELITRGILIKDTQSKAVSLITSHLQSYIGGDFRKNNISKSNFINFHKFQLTKYILGKFCITDNFYLGYFGYIFGDSLARGHAIYFYCQSQVILTVCLFAKLCIQAGYVLYTCINMEILRFTFF